MEGSQNTTFPAKTSVCLEELALTWGKRGPSAAHPDVQSRAVPFQTVSRNLVHMDVVVEVLHARAF